MKKVVEKALKAEVSMKLLGIGALAVLVVLLIPIVRIMTYCVPWYDDFSYGQFTKIFWEMKNSFLGAVEGALYNAKTMWYAWQGTYTSCFFMSMMPAVWGTKMYAYGLWAILFTLVISIFCLTRVLLKDVLKSADRWSCLAVQSIVAATVVVFMRSAVEGFFWYNSAVHYTAMHSLGILFIAGLLKLVYVKGKVPTVLLLIGSVCGAALVGGVNNVTALQVGLVMLSILGFGAIFRKKNVLWILPSCVCYAFALYKNMGAPGNEKRMAHYVGMMLSPVEAILRSFQSAFTYLDDFTGWMVLAIIIFMVPIIWYIVSRAEFQFKYPVLILVWSVCLYATGFTPTLFTMGHTLLGRATNMAKVTFQILLFINLFYWIGWLNRYLKSRDIAVTVKNTWSFFAVMMAVMVGIFAVEPNKGGAFSSYCAYHFVHTGEANNYYQEYLTRVALCESDEMDVVVEPYKYKPWVLCLGDLKEDPNYEPNRFMADFFHKNSITCIAPVEKTQE